MQQTMKNLPAHLSPVDFVPADDRLKSGMDLWACIETTISSHPDKLAMDDGQNPITYRQCLPRINDLSSRLTALTLPAGRVSIILLETSIVSALAILAHIKAGIVFVPVDIAISAERVRALVGSCRPAVIVTRSEYEGLVPESCGDCDLILVDRMGDIVEAPARPAGSPQEQVCRILTSGSTGSPKQIIYTRKMILHDVTVRTETLRISPSDHFCQWIGGTSLPLMTIFLSFLNGASLHIHDIHRYGLVNLPEWIRENGITLLRLTPTLLRLFMAQEPRLQDLSSVRLVSTGGETLTPADVARFRQVFPENTVLLNHLSATEYRVACQYFVGPTNNHDDKQIPVGYAVKDFEIQIVDEQGDPLADGQAGEIAIRSAYISPGFVESGSGEIREYNLTPRGFYLTGDLGLRRADGCIVHLGRKDRMTKIRGVRLQLDEVESVLSSVAGVDKVAALSVTSPDGESALAACVVEAPGAAVSLQQLRQTLYTEMGLFGLPHYLIKRAELPVTSNGKVDRLRLQSELPSGFCANDAQME